MGNKSRLIKKKHGFTLIEVVVVFAVLAILAAIAIPAYTKHTQKAKETVDNANVSILNSVTVMYAMKAGKTPQTVFIDEATDQEKIMVLVADHYLDEEPVPNQAETVFSFNQSAGKWYLAFKNGTKVVFRSEERRVGKECISRW